MKVLSRWIMITFATMSFLFTLFVLNNLMYFLSVPRIRSFIYIKAFFSMEKEARINSIYASITNNIFHIIIFIIQHSFLRKRRLLCILRRHGLVNVARPIYCFMSSLCLYVGGYVFYMNFIVIYTIIIQHYLIFM